LDSCATGFAGGNGGACCSHETDEAFCSICFGEFVAHDPSASAGDARGHGIIFECGHAAVLHLSCLALEAQQDRPFQCPLCRTKFGFSKMCICGCELQERLTSKPIPEYDGAGVCCDHCSRSVSQKETIYHCPKGKSAAHPAGYDVCGGCADTSGPPQASSVDVASPTCNCGHRLVFSPRASNICDINGTGCKKDGTSFRCASGCDFDVCDVCVSSWGQFRRARRPAHTHLLRARQNSSATRATAQRSSAQIEATHPRSQSATSRRPSLQSGSGRSRLLTAGAALVRSTATWRA